MAEVGEVVHARPSSPMAFNADDALRTGSESAHRCRVRGAGAARFAALRDRVRRRPTRAHSRSHARTHRGLRPRPHHDETVRASHEEQVPHRSDSTKRGIADVRLVAMDAATWRPRYSSHSREDPSTRSDYASQSLATSRGAYPGPGATCAKGSASHALDDTSGPPHACSSSAAGYWRFRAMRPFTRSRFQGQHAGVRWANRPTRLRVATTASTPRGCHEGCRWSPRCVHTVLSAIKPYTKE